MSGNKPASMGKMENNLFGHQVRNTSMTQDGLEPSHLSEVLGITTTTEKIQFKIM